MLNLIPESEIKTIDELLTPIATENPAGPYLKRDPALSRLKELRAIVLDTSSGLWKTKGKQGDSVTESMQLAEDFLKNQNIAFDEKGAAAPTAPAAIAHIKRIWPPAVVHMWAWRAWIVHTSTTTPKTKPQI